MAGSGGRRSSGRAVAMASCLQPLRPGSDHRFSNCHLGDGVLLRLDQLAQTLVPDTQCCPAWPFLIFLLGSEAVHAAYCRSADDLVLARTETSTAQTIHRVEPHSSYSDPTDRSYFAASGRDAGALQPDVAPPLYGNLS